MNVYIYSTHYSHEFGSFPIKVFIAANTLDEAKWIARKYGEWESDGLEYHSIDHYDTENDRRYELLKNVQYDGDKPTVVADYNGDYHTCQDFLEGFEEVMEGKDY